MGVLKKRLDDDLKKAAKAQDKVYLSTLRLVRAAIKNKEISLKKELDDKEVIETISQLVKQRRDSIEQFKKGGRQDLVEKEEAELEILLSYLPRQLTRDEIKEKAFKVIKETGAKSSKDFGRVMKVLMEELKGSADGRTVSEVVKECLSAL